MTLLETFEAETLGKMSDKELAEHYYHMTVLEVQETPEDERRALNAGYLYPNDHPFAVFEGNYTGSGYIDWSSLMRGKLKPASSEEDAISLPRTAVLMTNKKSYTPSGAPGILRRAA